MSKEKTQLPGCPWHSGIACKAFEQSGNPCEKCAWGDPHISLHRLVNKYGDKITDKITKGEELISDRIV